MPSLAPREHGAYGQLFLPLAVALASSRPTLAGVALAVAAGCAFFAHEPLLVMLGQRGRRAQRMVGPRARRQLTWLSLLGAGAAVVGLAGANPETRLLVLLPLALGATTLGFALLRRERSLPGELVAAFALSSSAVPVASAGGLDGRAVLSHWTVWALGFAGVVWAVRAAIAGFKRQLAATRRVLPMVVPLALAGYIGRALGWSPLLILAFALIYLVALLVATLAPHPRHLHRVGWALMAATSAAGALLIAAAHT